jgi:hypothetical protein
LVRRVEWAENELSVIEQLQLLKLDTVVNERRVAAFRTAQQTSPYYPPAFMPPPAATGDGGDGGSSLQRALQEQLVCAATPDAALQLIGFLEQMQTLLEAELKALPPQEKKAVQGPVDALRPRLDALPRREAPPPPPQPVAPPRITGFAPANPGRIGMMGSAAAPRVRLPARAVLPPPPSPHDQVAFQAWMRQQFTQVQQQLTQGR